MTSTRRAPIPKGFDIQAHQLWTKGQTQSAIKKAIDTLNTVNTKTDRRPLMIQVSYYLFCLRDYISASNLQHHILEDFPDDHETLLNYAVTLSRAEKNEDALKSAEQYVSHISDNYAVYDLMAKSYYKVKRYNKAGEAGRKSLQLKAQTVCSAPSKVTIPDETPESYVKNKRKVISFSLWGTNPRYIHGALRNVLLAPDIYPGWEIWIYLDGSVPAPLPAILKDLGATIKIKPSNSSVKERLCWRFEVANEENVGRFLVRDIDSVMSVREYLLVQKWLQSGQYFHIIRDWWTHTDLMLAGMWGGVAGILPDIKSKQLNYMPPLLETANIDQWFLRDCVYNDISNSCLIHDRCFGNDINPQEIGKETASNNFHIGQDEYAVKGELQRKLIQPWLEKIYQS